MNACVLIMMNIMEKKETGSSVRDGLLSYTEMLAKASSSRSHLIRDLKERK